MKSFVNTLLFTYSHDIKIYNNYKVYAAIVKNNYLYQCKLTLNSV